MSQTTTEKLKVLFLCTGNSCRSQMAEGWGNSLKDNTIEAFSAGIKKHGMNPLAIRAMEEAGVDITSQYSKTIEELPVQEFDWVITLCGHANESCPYFPGKKIHQGFDDPPQLASDAKTDEEKMVHYSRVRDEIRDFVTTLPESLEVMSA